MLAKNRLMLTAYYKEKNNPLQKLPLEIFIYILELADDRPIIEKYFSKYPHPMKYGSPGDWDFNLLIKNANITPRFIEKHPELLCKVNLEDFSYNSAITPEFIEYYAKNKLIDLKKLNWRRLSHNKNITEEFLKKIITKNKVSLNQLNWNLMATNPSISPKFFIENMDLIKYRTRKKWWILVLKLFRNRDAKCREIGIWKWLSKNPTLTPEFIKKYIKYKNGFADIPWNMAMLSKNPAITPNLIEELNTDGYITLDKWDWRWLANNPSISLEFIEKHIENFNTAENIKYLSKNPIITPEFIKKLDAENKIPLNKWNWRMMSKNTSINSTFINELIDNNKISGDELDWYELFKNPSISLTFIEKNIGRPKDPFMIWWGFLSKNPNVTTAFVEKYIHKPWDWNGLTKNPKISFKFIQKHPEKPWFNRYIQKKLN